MQNYKYIVFFFLIVGVSCEEKSKDEFDENLFDQISFYRGVDLSYLNQLLDCGALFKTDEGNVEDPYKIFVDAGANLIRVRLWHTPDSKYSNLIDVKKTIRNAKNNGAKVLLDFHYSDTWADPAQQFVPNAWISDVYDTPKLGELLYDYTFNTLKSLDEEGLIPDIVQVGNEINRMILTDETKPPMDWERNSYLINKGLQAVKDYSENIDTMLHIAQPENALVWFNNATKNGVVDYDWIGLSYYPKFSNYDLTNLEAPLKELIETYKKRLMVVETAYPFTLEDIDNTTNRLSTDALLDDYPATQDGQLAYLNDLKNVIKDAGGEGLIYWAPDYVSIDCSQLGWKTGSPRDNVILFDSENKPTKGMRFLAE